MATPALRKDDSLVLRHKRRAVALSCAECRRLKLKCSRQFPCSNCVKKGCSAICPEGSLTTGKGNRFVLANTEVLHDKINQLANRVRNLEDALSESHSRYSEQTHPLLTPDLLQIKRPLERERPDETFNRDEKADQAEAIDALGSLSISQDGRSTFFGTTANSWYLLKNEEGSSDDEDPSNLPTDPTLSPDISRISSSFPFPISSSANAYELRSNIIASLPPAPLARSLVDLYYRHAAWMYTPINELDFFENIFRPLYDVRRNSMGSIAGDNETVGMSVGSPGSAGTSSLPESLSAHSLAILCMVLALGSLLDLEAPPYNAQATQFYQLARASLSIDSVLEEQTVPGIQALLLMCHFMFLSEMGSPRWVIMGMVVKMAQSIGLHRDSGKWKLNVEETQKRRELFYEILTYDSWQSLTYGRPPSFSTAHIDSKFPHDSVTNEQGETEMSFQNWKHRFAATCLSVVHDQAFGARTPSYKTVRELDRKVRDYYVPPSLQIPGFGSGLYGMSPSSMGGRGGETRSPPSVQLTMQRYITYAIKEITLFYMHRGFFAQALDDNPADPMGSRYGPSVLAAYNSACSFVALIESLFQQQPGLTERMWFLFTHVFSCSIVLGSIAIKTQMQIAPSALSYLESAHNLFCRVSDNPRTQKILPILRNLRERAHAALSSEKHTGSSTSSDGLSNAATSSHSHSSPNINPHTGTVLSPPPPPSGGVSKIKHEVSELSALGGMTRLVSRRSSQSPSYTSSPSSQPASPPQPQHMDPAAAGMNQGIMGNNNNGAVGMGMGMGMDMGGATGSGMGMGMSMEMETMHTWGTGTGGFTMDVSMPASAGEFGTAYSSMHGVVERMGSGPPQPSQHQVQFQQRPQHQHQRQHSQPLSLQQQQQQQQQQMGRQHAPPPQPPPAAAAAHLHQQQMQRQSQQMANHSPISPVSPHMRVQPQHYGGMVHSQSQTQAQNSQRGMYTGGNAGGSGANGNLNHIQQLAGGALPEYFGYPGGNDYNTQMTGGGVGGGGTQPEMSMASGMQQQGLVHGHLQRHPFPASQHHQHHHLSGGMGAAGGMMHSSQDIQPPDLQDSWFNFMAHFGAER